MTPPELIMPCHVMSSDVFVSLCLMSSVSNLFFICDQNVDQNLVNILVISFSISPSTYLYLPFLQNIYYISPFLTLMSKGSIR